MTRAVEGNRTEFLDYGLSCFSFRPGDGTGWRGPEHAAPPHTHLELEMLLVEAGWAELEVAGRRERIAQGQLVAFWGGLPHRVADADRASVAHVAQLPIGDVLSSLTSAHTVDVLLDGALLRATPEPGVVGMDEAAFCRWTADLTDSSTHRRSAAHLEIQARLHRLVAASRPRGEVAGATHNATAGIAAAAIRFVIRHFMEDISVEQIAEALGYNHDHVMQCFRQTCGVTLWEYVTRVRIGEARRLLAATDLSILGVCHRAGFSSTSRMYDAFNRYCGQTPGEVRRQSLTRAL